MGDRLLHISANQFPALSVNHHTKKIWKELALGFDEYHIIARAKDNKFHSYREGNIVLHLVPKIGNRSLFFMISSFYIFRIIPKYRITKLLAQSSILGGFTASLAKKYFGIPLMVEIHGDVYFKYFLKTSVSHRFLSFLSKYSLKNATKVRSLSTEMTRLLKNEGVVNNVVLIPNRVDLDLFNSPKQNYQLQTPIRIISVGRFVEQKGYDLAIKAVQGLSKEFDIELYLIGGGKLYSELERLRNNNANIHLIKWINQNELIPLLRKSDIYIQPSKPLLGEAMPRTLLEAMALGLPIISTKIAAIPGILHHLDNSIIIEPGNLIHLEGAIKQIILNKNLRRKIALKAYDDVSTKYEWNQVFDIYRKELVSL